jgi:hypothetical protein
MNKKVRASISRQNAQHSTGPRTPQGMQRSAMNALKHGFTGSHMVLLLDETEAYNRLTHALLTDLKPLTELERQTVQKMIDAHFRLNRLAGVENNIFNFGIFDNTNDSSHEDRIETMMAQTRAWMERSSSFDALGRYEARLTRQLFQFTVELQRLQRERRTRESIERNQTHRERKQNKKDTFDLASFGKKASDLVIGGQPWSILFDLPADPPAPDDETPVAPAHFAAGASLPDPLPVPAPQKEVEFDSVAS